MYKSKKLLSVFLAVLMIMSFTPLFASAATITLNSTNMIVLEAPKITYGDQTEVDKVVADYGVSAKDFTYTGGKIGYIASEGAEPVIIPGTFEGALSTKLAVGDNVALRIKFIPEDSVTYSTVTISATSTLAEGVTLPTARIVGIATTLVEMPTPKTTVLGIGNKLATGARLSGGKVTDANGAEVSGTWSYVNNRTMDTEGVFEEDIQWKKSGYETIYAKVTITVKHFKTSMAEAPVAAGIQYTKKLSSATLTGGKVIDENGNDVTSAGKWKYVNPSFVPEKSGEYDITWTAIGYDTVNTKVYVEVQADEASLVEAPEPRFVRTSAFLYQNADNIYFKDGSGKVVDKDGNDITSLGTWKGIPDGKTIICRDTEIDVRWEALGYAPVYAKMTVLVIPNYSSNITLSKNPEFSGSLNAVYQADKYLSDYISVIPGEVLDENGKAIEGKWSFTVNGYGSQTPEEIKANASSYTLTQTFTPNDASLPTLTKLISNVTLKVSKTNFDIIDGFEIVLNYGANFSGSIKSSDLNFSTVGTIPEEAGIKTISWSKADFDPSTADYGTVKYVNVKIEPVYEANYNARTVTVPVRIQNYTIENAYTDWSNLGAYSRGQDNIDGIINYSVDFTHSRLFGSVTVKATDGTNEWIVDTVESVKNESGMAVFEKTGKWQAPHDGDYTFSYVYNSAEEDTATVLNPVMKKNEAVSVDIRAIRTITIIIGNQTIKKELLEGSKEVFYWSQLTDESFKDFEYWEYKDAQGNIITPEGIDSTDYNLKIQMPEYDITVTAKGAVENAVVTDGSIGSSLWAFWQKLVDFIVGIYRTIMDIFVPYVETL